jgi:predicted nucleotidyltransferase component of viral defense system
MKSLNGCRSRRPPLREIARLSEKDRRELFRTAAQRKGVHEAIIEKDFWVCWILDYLFHESPWKDHLAFKGGTSLSKAYGAIERFSEDIDLILDWRSLGYSLQEPWENRSITKQDEFGKESNRRTSIFLTERFVPLVRAGLADMLGSSMEVEAHGQDVLIRYPRAFSLGAIQPQIKLEIGPMAAWFPNEMRAIRPYSADQFPGVFHRSETTVRTIAVERTFWEKATILHQEAYRGPEKEFPQRYARHYYDLFRLSCSPVRERALARLPLLLDVVKFKMRFYHCSWAKYEQAKPGSLKLLPPPSRADELEKDYRATQPMLFGIIPSFQTILKELATLEKLINRDSPVGTGLPSTRS